MSAPIVILAIVVIGVAGCDHPKTKHALAPKKPVSFQETLFTSVIPTSDGGAYAVGFDSGLWYLRGSEAVKVQFSELSTNSNDTFFITLEITPLLDGGAYAHSIIDRSFWHLREGIAKRVTEVSSLSSMPIQGPVSAFSLYVSERQKRLEAESRLGERPDFDEEPPDPEPPE